MVQEANLEPTPIQDAYMEAFHNAISYVERIIEPALGLDNEQIFEAAWHHMELYMNKLKKDDTETIN